MNEEWCIVCDFGQWRVLSKPQGQIGSAIERGSFESFEEAVSFASRMTGAPVVIPLLVRS